MLNIRKYKVRFFICLLFLTLILTILSWVDLPEALAQYPNQNYNYLTGYNFYPLYRLNNPYYAFNIPCINLNNLNSLFSKNIYNIGINWYNNNLLGNLLFNASFNPSNNYLLNILGRNVSPVYPTTYSNYLNLIEESVSPPTRPTVPASTIIPLPVSKTEETPAPAPQLMTGEWQSLQLRDNAGNTSCGELVISRIDGLLRMENSLLLLGVGSLIQFNYTPTLGDAPIFLKATFYSYHTVELTGMASNHLCPLNVFCGLAGYFEVEGEYVIKDSRGLLIDKGIFNLSYP